MDYLYKFGGKVYPENQAILKSKFDEDVLLSLAIEMEKIMPSAHYKDYFDKVLLPYTHFITYENLWFRLMKLPFDLYQTTDFVDFRQTMGNLNIKNVQWYVTTRIVGYLMTQFLPLNSIAKDEYLLFRGLNFDYIYQYNYFMESLQPVYYERSVTSTSTSYDVTKYWVYGNNFPIILVYHVPSSLKCLAYSRRHESEILLPPCTTSRVIGTTKNERGQTIIHLKIIAVGRFDDKGVVTQKPFDPNTLRNNFYNDLILFLTVLYEQKSGKVGINDKVDESHPLYERFKQFSDRELEPCYHDMGMYLERESV